MQDAPSAEHRKPTPITVPAKWAKLLRRLMGLGDGQHMVVITVRDGALQDWSELVRSKVEG